MHPSFLPTQLVQRLIRARRSLKLLRSAQPVHPLLIATVEETSLRWIWTESDIQAATEGILGRATHDPENQKSVPLDTPPLVPSYSEDLRDFLRFHCEPGTQTLSDVVVSEASRPSQFEVFLEAFPDPLPSLTPTLPDLANLVLSPLLQRIASISTALLGVFLSSESHLHLHSNLVILRSYLLLTSHSFKSRLQAALFSDADECIPLSTSTSDKSGAKVHKSTAKSRSKPTPSTEWAVGLSRKLMEGGWPPGGANLSFSLRTVIIDSLEHDHYHEFRKAREAPDESNSARVRILREAEWRLGFAIRDLPTGSEAKWLNPRCTSAFPFNMSYSLTSLSM